MAEYRRNGTREFFRIEGDKVRRVLNKEKHVLIYDYECAMISEEILTDHEVCTQEEFETAFKNARDRILLDRL